jgi:phage gpG-like protein
MAAIFATVQDKTFNDAVRRAARQIGDLRPLFGEIRRSFYQANKAIFSLKGKGQYEDFSGPKIAQTWKSPGRPNQRTRNGSLTAYQWAKVQAKKKGIASSEINDQGYPLLLFSGRLRESLTNEQASEAISVITKTTLIMGTSVPYAGFHQSGTSKMPMRPILFIDPATSQSGKIRGIISRRNEAWVRSIERFVSRALKSSRGGE